MLLTGVDDVQAGLRKLAALKLLPVYEAVEKEVASFGESLPLMKELKNEALRWGRWLCARRLLLRVELLFYCEAL